MQVAQLLSQAMHLPVAKLFRVCMKYPAAQLVQIVGVWQVRQGLLQFTQRLVDVSKKVELSQRVHSERDPILHRRQLEAVHWLQTPALRV